MPSSLVTRITRAFAASLHEYIPAGESFREATDGLYEFFHGFSLHFSIVPAPELAVENEIRASRIASVRRIVDL
jgi:hypothetical protein